MFAGDMASDMVINGARNNALLLGAHLQNSCSEINRLERVIEELNSANGANLAVRYALAGQLELHDPQNPLLIDAALVARIQDKAEQVLKERNHFDAAREVGRTFPIPGRDKDMVRPRMQLPTLMVPVERMNEAYAGAIALRNALGVQLHRLDPYNPLLQDPMLIERVKACGASAYRMCGNDFEAARDVGNTFVVPGRE